MLLLLLSRFSRVRLCATPYSMGGMPVFPIQHPLPELTQSHVHQVSDVIQPSQPLPFSSPPTFNLS